MHTIKQRGLQAGSAQRINRAPRVACFRDASIGDDECTCAVVTREFTKTRERAVAEDNARSRGVIERGERGHARQATSMERRL